MAGPIPRWATSAFRTISYAIHSLDAALIMAIAWKGWHRRRPSNRVGARQPGNCWPGIPHGTWKRTTWRWACAIGSVLFRRSASFWAAASCGVRNCFHWFGRRWPHFWETTSTRRRSLRRNWAHGQGFWERLLWPKRCNSSLRHFAALLRLDAAVAVPGRELATPG